MKRRKFLGGFNRFRLMVTLGLAVLLPAAALIFVNFFQLRSFERDKVLEAAIHRNFQEMLAISEKRIDKKALRWPKRREISFHLRTRTYRKNRDVTALSWGRKFHAKVFVSEPAMRLIQEHGGSE